MAVRRSRRRGPSVANGFLIDGLTGRRDCGWVRPHLFLYHWRCRSALVPHQRPFIKMLALTVVLLFAASPVAAQTRQPLGAGGQTNNSQLTNTGVICHEEMVATFCNVATSPNTAGYGTHGGAATNTPSAAIPVCGEGVVAANELCD
jgi:hypothetical protein